MGKERELSICQSRLQRYRDLPRSPLPRRVKTYVLPFLVLILVEIIITAISSVGPRDAFCGVYKSVNDLMPCKDLYSIFG
jgi:hypothetical protein